MDFDPEGSYLGVASGQCSNGFVYSALHSVLRFDWPEIYLLLENFLYFSLGRHFTDAALCRHLPKPHL